MDETVEQAASIASAFLAHNFTRAEDVPQLIGAIHDALLGLGKPVQVPPPPNPAIDVPWKKTIRHDALISLVDGRSLKILKRHLAKAGYTPETHRQAFDLPRDYPLIAAGYSEARSAMAKSIGLGSLRKKAAAGTAAPSAKPKRAKKAA